MSYSQRDFAYKATDGKKVVFAKKMSPLKRWWKYECNKEELVIDIIGGIVFFLIYGFAIKSILDALFMVN